MARYNLPAHQWRSSSYSADNGGQCLEVQQTEDGLLAVGDSKARARGAFVSPPSPWTNFIEAVKHSQLGP